MAVYTMRPSLQNIDELGNDLSQSTSPSYRTASTADFLLSSGLSIHPPIIRLDSPDEVDVPIIRHESLAEHDVERMSTGFGESFSRRIQDSMDFSVAKADHTGSFSPSLDEFGIVGGGVLAKDWAKCRQITAQSVRSELEDWTFGSEEHLDDPQNKVAGAGDAANSRKRGNQLTPAVLAKQYTLKKMVGEGAFGVVYSGTHLESHEPVAVKSIAIAKLNEQWMVDQLQEEVQLTAMFQHPYIVTMHQIMQDSTHVYLVMDLLTGPTLSNFVLQYPHDPDSASKRRGLPMNLVARYFWQMLVSIGHLHVHGVVHRDVKPENYLFCKNSETSPLKLIDFGFASKFQPGVPITLQVGSPYFMAPEILTSDTGYDESVDIYAVGVCAYFAIVSSLPYTGVEVKSVIQAAREGKLCTDGPQWENVPKECIQLIRQMMSLDPSKRPSAMKLLSEQNTWLRIHGWEKQSPYAVDQKCCVVS